MSGGIKWRSAEESVSICNLGWITTKKPPQKREALSIAFLTRDYFRCLKHLVSPALPA
jgi:hypothetical protein